MYVCIYGALRKEAVGKIAPAMRDLPLPFHCRVYENAPLAALDPLRATFVLLYHWPRPCEISRQTWVAAPLILI